MIAYGPPDESCIGPILRLKLRAVTRDALPVDGLWTFSMLNAIAKLGFHRSEFTEIGFLIFKRGGVLTALLQLGEVERMSRY